MKRQLVLCFLASFVLAACEDDPARKVKIATPPAPAPAAEKTAAPPTAAPAATPADGSTAAPLPAPTVTKTAAPSTTKSAAAKTPAKTAADPEGPRPTDNIVHVDSAKLGKPHAPTLPTWRPAGCPPLAETETGTSLVTVIGPCAFELRSTVSCESTGDDFLVTMSRPGADGTTVMIYMNVEHYTGPGVYDGGQMFLGVQDKNNIYRWSSDAVSATVGPEEASVTFPTTRLEAEPLFVNCSGSMKNFMCEDRDSATALDGTEEVIGGTFTCTKGGE